MLVAVDSPQPPLRLLLGEGTLEQVTAEYQQRLATWRAWAGLSGPAHERPAG